jgi:elongation of very long chain fatty acids protein 4
MSSKSKEIKEIDQEPASMFSSALLRPLYLTAAYLFLLRGMAQTLYKAVDAVPYSDPFKDVWWSGPIFFSIAYLCMVYFGTKYMKNREPFLIKPYIFTYNLYQCILNLWCVAAVIHEVYSNPMFQGIWGTYPEETPRAFRISFLVWVHYNNKYIELLDTLFMILRKKNRQISFLHCYHHVLLIWAWFLVCRVGPSGDCFFGATVNSFIHVIMYGYYTLALLGIPCPWKKWITTCQMIQFCLCLSHSVYALVKGNAPPILPIAQAFVMINMLVLFGAFYKKEYSQPKNKELKGVSEQHAVKQD